MKKIIKLPKDWQDMEIRYVDVPDFTPCTGFVLDADDIPSCIQVTIAGRAGYVPVNTFIALLKFMLETGDGMEAVQILRHVTGLTLKDAKDFLTSL